MTENSLKIGILGEIRAGKDTLASLIFSTISQQHTVNCNSFTFSEGIHDVLKMITPHIYKDGKPRKALQTIGQAAREVDPDVWINYLFNAYKFKSSVQEPNTVTIVHDVRQPNEAKRLREMGFILIKVIACPEVRKQRAIEAGDNFNEGDLSHSTEIVLHDCPYDFLIENSLDMDNLQQQVDLFIKTHYRRT